MTRHLNAQYIHAGLPGEKTDRFIGLTGAQIFHEMMHEHGVQHSHSPSEPGPARAELAFSPSPSLPGLRVAHENAAASSAQRAVSAAPGPLRFAFPAAAASSGAATWLARW